ncbi:zinc-binding dehydrogenase [Nocardiopsis trehalosi]|jgi:NADPH2:quinone reductase|uniref:zinc-binding dehydrogenase n=1 Tax=Nocardiopsis trehalosi TaxID=109329 RepID=UPI0008360083|nr:zinc-binding dehydrogenase [Nocardiopsis trehalosi]
MRVARVREFGGPEVLETVEVPDPRPGPGEVVIDVAAADVVFVETQIRAGWGREYFAHTPPYVPGGAVAGTVSATGPGTDPAWRGRRVAAHLADEGGYAERVAAAAATLIPVPDGVGLHEAAALATDGATGTTLLDGARIGAGDRVLITGAAGAMGVLLVQLAAAEGAAVVAAARGARKTALLRDLGAHAVVDTGGPDWAERARAALGPHGADVVFDGVGGEVGDAAFALTADKGRFSAHGAAGGRFAAVDPEAAARRGVTVAGIDELRLPPDGVRRQAERMLRAHAEGRVRPVIGQTFPLERAADAHRALEERAALGKTLLLP